MRGHHGSMFAGLVLVGSFGAGAGACTLRPLDEYRCDATFDVFQDSTAVLPDGGDAKDHQEAIAYPSASVSFGKSQCSLVWNLRDDTHHLIVGCSLHKAVGMFRFYYERDTIIRRSTVMKEGSAASALHEECDLDDAAACLITNAPYHDVPGPAPNIEQANAPADAFVYLEIESEDGFPADAIAISNFIGPGAGDQEWYPSDSAWLEIEKIDREVPDASCANAGGSSQ